MNQDQEIYEAVGKLLWSIMSPDVREIYFFGDIYPNTSGSTVKFLKTDGELGWFNFGESPQEVINQIMPHGMMTYCDELYRKHQSTNKLGFTL